MMTYLSATLAEPQVFSGYGPSRAHVSRVHVPRIHVSGVHVLIKALHMLAMVWMATVAFLWLTPRTGLDTIGALNHAVPPACAIALAAIGLNRWTRAQAGDVFREERREYLQALSWTIVPTLFLMIGAWLTVQ
jgi:hypothetical protein